VPAPPRPATATTVADGRLQPADVAPRPQSRRTHARRTHARRARTPEGERQGRFRSAAVLAKSSTDPAHLRSSNDTPG